MNSSVMLKPRSAVSVTMFIVALPFFIGSVASVVEREFSAVPIFAVLGLAFWGPVFSKRIVYSQGELSCRAMGFRIWGVSAQGASAVYGRAGDYGGLPAYIIRNARNKRIGSISTIQFPVSDIQRLLAVAGIREEDDGQESASS